MLCADKKFGQTVIFDNIKARKYLMNWSGQKDSEVYLVVGIHCYYSIGKGVTWKIWSQEKMMVFQAEIEKNR